jgi:hypothetical protein
VALKGWPGRLEGPKFPYNDEVTGSNPVTPTNRSCELPPWPLPARVSSISAVPPVIVGDHQVDAVLQGPKLGLGQGRATRRCGWGTSPAARPHPPPAVRRAGADRGASSTTPAVWPGRLRAGRSGRRSAGGQSVDTVFSSASTCRCRVRQTRPRWALWGWGGGARRTGSRRGAARPCASLAGCRSPVVGAVQPQPTLQQRNSAP